MLTDQEIDELMSLVPNVNKAHNLGPNVLNILLYDLATGGPRSYHFPVHYDHGITRLEMVKSLIRLGANPYWRKPDPYNDLRSRPQPSHDAIAYDASIFYGQQKITEYFDSLEKNSQ